MITDAFFWIVEHTPRGRRIAFRLLFERLARIFRDADRWTFMNYGYAEAEDQSDLLWLLPRDENDRYCIKLYHHICSGFELTGKNVLEISCGRGGGASYIARYLGPRQVTAVDIASNGIAFCRRVHRHPSLRFMVADAENLPFPANSFDVVVNVEASFCYRDIGRFLAEVHRVLRPDGCFLYADLRPTHELDALRAAVACSPMLLIEQRDITANVVHALVRDGDRRLAEIRVAVPLPFRPIMHIFAGTRGTRVPLRLASRQMQYVSYAMRKAAHAAVGATASAITAPSRGLTVCEPARS